MSKSEFYDVSPEMAHAIKTKAAQRAARKAEYVKLMSDPYRWATQTVPVDMGIERFEAQRTLKGSYPFFRPTYRTFAWFFFGVWVPILGMTFWTSNDRAEKEHRYRTGQVAYKDRIERFA